MQKEQTANIAKKQEEFYNSGVTKDVQFRLSNLKKMKQAYSKNSNKKKWETYLNDLKTKHKRKYSLLEKLNSL